MSASMYLRADYYSSRFNSRRWLYQRAAGELLLDHPEVRKQIGGQAEQAVKAQEPMEDT